MSSAVSFTPCSSATELASKSSISCHLLLHGGSGDGLQVEGLDGGGIKIHLVIVTLEGSHSSGGVLHLGTLLPDVEDDVEGLVELLHLEGGQHGEQEALTMCHCPLLEIEMVKSDLSGI